MIRFEEVRDKDYWNGYLTEKGGSFTQSWQWGDVEEKEGNEAFRYEIFDEEKSLGLFSIYLKSTPLGRYGYISRGPVVGERVLSENEWVLFFDALKSFAKKNNLFFILIDPLSEINYSGLSKTKNRQPRRTIFLDLTKSIDELLQNLNDTKRYGIRYAEKHGVKVRKSDKSEKDFELFWGLLSKTASRKKFGVFGKAHFRHIIDSDISDLFIAEYGGGAEAAAEVVEFGDTVSYLHAGTSGKNNKIMASYFLVWEILKDAKSRGFKKMDLWGIDENKWPGVTAFKKSFGGYEVSYPDAGIVIYKKLRYLTYKSLHLVKKILRV